MSHCAGNRFSGRRKPQYVTLSEADVVAHTWAEKTLFSAIGIYYYIKGRNRKRSSSTWFSSSLHSFPRLLTDTKTARQKDIFSGAVEWGHDDDDDDGTLLAQSPHFNDRARAASFECRCASSRILVSRAHIIPTHRTRNGNRFTRPRRYPCPDLNMHIYISIYMCVCIWFFPLSRNDFLRFSRNTVWNRWKRSAFLPSPATWQR